MVELSLIEPGMQVRIVEKWVPGCCQNRSGMMDCWLGKVMTVKGHGYGSISMVEDSGIWAWNKHTIAEIIDTTSVPFVCDLL